ncbi:MAG: hypothetical protein MI742_11720 [Desulfobacterales bacterium]|nr:hypothetical protein [Desulfobacterales bacterium]
MNLIPFFLFAVFVFLVILFFAHLMGRTMRFRDEYAVERMNAAELAYLEKVKKIEGTMEPEEMIAILGKPKKYIPDTRIQWQAPGKNPLHFVVVRYQGRRPFSIRWVKLGVFVWERLF